MSRPQESRRNPSSQAAQNSRSQVVSCGSQSEGSSSPPDSSQAPHPAPMPQADLSKQVGNQAGRISTPSQDKIEPRQIILRKVLDLIPPPLGLALVVGVTLLMGVAGLIDSSFKDFDLRLALSSMWFLFALVVACASWLAATFLARKRLGWKRVSGFAIFFLLVGAISGSYALRMAHYTYNELGFYAQRSWHGSRADDKPHATQFEWRIEAVKPAVGTLSVEMPVNPDCKFTDFQPPPPPVRDPSISDVTKVGWNACTFVAADFTEVIVENLAGAAQSCSSSLLQMRLSLPGVVSYQSSVPPRSTVSDALPAESNIGASLCRHGHGFGGVCPAESIATGTPCSEGNRAGEGDRQTDSRASRGYPSLDREAPAEWGARCKLRARHNTEKREL
jgi:hypothetical protein